MNDDTVAPTLAAARARIAAVQPAAYARTRNALDGAVSGLSPYLTHGLATSYEALDRIARRPMSQACRQHATPAGGGVRIEPGLSAVAAAAPGWRVPDAGAVAGRDVWIVHPWSLGALPAALPVETKVIGVVVDDFHRAWPWSERRWQFVGRRMAELAADCWQGDAARIGAALKGARSVRSIDEPHLAPWLGHWAECDAAPALFPAVDRRCDSFSQWWARASRGLDSAADLLVHGRA